MADELFDTTPPPTIKVKAKKRVMPGARSLTLMRKEGYLVGTVEKWIPNFGARKNNPKAPERIRKDLFGWMDILAVRGNQADTVGIQATSGSNLANRVNKIFDGKEALTAKIWLRAGNRIECHGWVKRPVTKTRKREIHEVVRREIYLIPPPDHASGDSLGVRDVVPDQF